MVGSCVAAGSRAGIVEDLRNPAFRSLLDLTLALCGFADALWCRRRTRSCA
jgi:hypothetical protein